MADVRIVPNAAGREQIDRAVDQMLGRLANAIAADARRYAPRDTGALQMGVEAEEPVDGRVSITASRDVPGDDPRVPVYVELGTEDTPPQPFLRPALYQRRSL